VELKNKLGDERKEIPILDYYRIQGIIVLYQLKKAIFFLIKKTKVAIDDFEGQI